MQIETIQRPWEFFSRHMSVGLPEYRSGHRSQKPFTPTQFVVANGDVATRMCGWRHTTKCAHGVKATPASSSRQTRHRSQPLSAATASSSVFCTAPIAAATNKTTTWNLRTTKSSPCPKLVGMHNVLDDSKRTWNFDHELWKTWLKNDCETDQMDMS